MEKILGACVISVMLEICLDLTGFADVASTVFGAWQIYHPVGWIVAGLFLIAGASLAARNRE